MKKTVLLIALVLVFAASLSACAARDAMLDVDHAVDGFVDDVRDAVTDDDNGKDTNSDDYSDGATEDGAAGADSIIKADPKAITEVPDKSIYEPGGSAYDGNGNILHDLPDVTSGQQIQAPLT